MPRTSIEDVPRTAEPGGAIPNSRRRRLPSSPIQSVDHAGDSTMSMRASGKPARASDSRIDVAMSSVAGQPE